MNQGIFQVVFNSVGALASSPVYTWLAPMDCTLLHVSAVNSTAYAGSVDVGSSADADGYLAAMAVGVSAAPAQKGYPTPADFAGAHALGAYPHIVDGTIVKVTVTDHGSHMADFCVVLTFSAG